VELSDARPVDLRDSAEVAGAAEFLESSTARQAADRERQWFWQPEFRAK
jgi:hypothetical protein